MLLFETPFAKGVSSSAIETQGTVPCVLFVHMHKKHMCEL